MSLVNPEMLQLCILFDDALADFCRHAGLPLEYISPSRNTDSEFYLNFERVSCKFRIPRQFP